MICFSDVGGWVECEGGKRGEKFGGFFLDEEVREGRGGGV